MRLRTSIVAPERFGDEDYSKVAATKTTTPAFPNLLAGATAAFDPHLPPAAFPSSTHPHPIVQPTNIDPESMIIDRPSYDIFIPVVHHDSTQTDALVTMPDGANEMPEFGRDFVDEVATSDEEPQNPAKSINRTAASTIRHTTWNQLAPSLQVEIFENLAHSKLGAGTYDVLGLNDEEIEDIWRHCDCRDKQVIAEDVGVQDLQRAQLNALLRTDHSSRLRADGWRQHVAYTRSYLPNITSRLDYFICTTNQINLARSYLDERGIDISALGQWGPTTAASLDQHRPVSHSAGRYRLDPRRTSEIADRSQKQANAPSQKRAVRSLVLKYAHKELPNPQRASIKVPGADTENHPRTVRGNVHGSLADTPKGIVPTQIQALSRLVSASSDSQSPVRIMGLRDRTSLKGTSAAEKRDAAIAVMRESGVGYDDSDDAYEEEFDTNGFRSLARLKINPPKPPQKPSESSDTHASLRPGTQDIMLKILPDGIAKVREKGLSEADASNDPLLLPTTPLITTYSPGEPQNTSQREVSRGRGRMPTLRSPFNLQAQRPCSPFMSNLLKIQHGAKGLNTPPASITQDQSQDLEMKTIPNRPKRDHHPDNGTITSEGIEMQSSEYLRVRKRKDSAAYQISPEWSPISRRSSYVSSSQLEQTSLEDKDCPITTPSTEVQHSKHNTGALDRRGSEASRQSKSPAQPTAYVKPSIAESGSPVPASVLSRWQQSGNGSKCPVSSTSTAFIGLEKAPSKPSIPYDTRYLNTGFGALIPPAPDTLPISNTQESGLSSPFRQAAEGHAEAVPTTPAAAVRVQNVAAIPSTSEGEQSQHDVLLSSPRNTSDSRGKSLKIPIPVPFSPSVAVSTGRPASNEDEYPTRGHPSIFKAPSKALHIASDPLEHKGHSENAEAGPSTPQSEARSKKDPGVGLKRGPRGPYKKTLEKQRVLVEATAAAESGTGTRLEEGTTTGKNKIDVKELDTSPYQESSSDTNPSTAPTEARGITKEKRLIRTPSRIPRKQTKAAQGNELFESKSVAAAEKSALNDIGARVQNNDPVPKVPKAVKQVRKVASEDEDYQQNTTAASESDTDTGLKKITTPKGGKKVVIDRAKGLGRDCQLNKAAKETKSCFSNTKPTTKPDLVTIQSGLPLRKRAASKAKKALPKPPQAMTATKKAASRTKRASSSGEGEAPLKKQKATPKPKEHGLNAEGSLSLKQQKATPKLTTDVNAKGSTSQKKKPITTPEEAAPNSEGNTAPTMKSGSISRELENLSVNNEGGSKYANFRGNQWRYADGTPRLDKYGTP